MSMQDTTTTPPPTEQAPLPNSPEAREADGTLKDTTQPPETKPETKSEETKPPEVKAEVPEAYAEFKAPEGKTLDKAVIESATPLFKELGLTQDQAQKLIDFYAENQVKTLNAPQEAYEKIRSDWRKEVLADPNLSSGGKLKPEVSQTIGRAIDGLGDPALIKGFREIMDVSGVGDNPHFVRAIHKWASAVTEGQHVAGKGPAEVKAPDAKPQSIASAIYPNLK